MASAETNPVICRSDEMEFGRSSRNRVLFLFFLSVDSVDPVGSSVVTYRVSLGRYRVSHPSPAFVLFFLQIFSADLEIEDVRSSTRENSHCLPLNRRVVRERDREREPAKTNGIGVSEKCSINTRERESER